MTTNRNKLLELAKEAGFVVDSDGEVWAGEKDSIDRFAALLQAQGEPSVGVVCDNCASVSGAVDERRTVNGIFVAGALEMAAHYAENGLKSTILAAQLRSIAPELSRAQATQPAQQAPAVSDHGLALRIVHEESGRTLSKADFDLCLRIAKRALLSQPAAAPISELKSHQQLWDEWHAAPSNQSQGGDKK